MNLIPNTMLTSSERRRALRTLYVCIAFGRRDSLIDEYSAIRIEDAKENLEYLRRSHPDHRWIVVRRTAEIIDLDGLSNLTEKEKASLEMKP